MPRMFSKEGHSGLKSNTNEEDTHFAGESHPSRWHSNLKGASPFWPQAEIPAADVHVQATQLGTSGASGICIKIFPLENVHVGRREEGKNDRGREGEKEGRKYQ